MKKLAWQIIGGTAALALVGAGTAYGIGIVNDIRANVPAPTPTSTAVVAEFAAYQETPVHPAPTPAVVIAPVVEAPAAPVEEPTQDDAVVNEDGSVSGTGCPAPYVDLGYGCQDPICGVDENGNDIPCTG